MKKKIVKLTLAKETVRNLEAGKLGEVGGAGSFSDCLSCGLDPCPNEFAPLTWIAYSCSC
jgi:hypothetical protein